MNRSEMITSDARLSAPVRDVHVPASAPLRERIVGVADFLTMMCVLVLVPPSSMLPYSEWMLNRTWCVVPAPWSIAQSRQGREAGVDGRAAAAAHSV